MLNYLLKIFRNNNIGIQDHTRKLFLSFSSEVVSLRSHLLNAILQIGPSGSILCSEANPPIRIVVRAVCEQSPYVLLQASLRGHLFIFLFRKLRIYSISLLE